jgi:TrmH family RNA methyltransferase
VKVNLDNIRIILAGIRNAGNIGSAARAMKNMGVREMALVDPAPYENQEVLNLGWGAEDLIKNAPVFDSLEDAVSNCGLVIGTTRRVGRLRRAVRDISWAIPRIAAASTKNRVAIIFGRENKGLSNEELELCQYSLIIPTSGHMPSLNVAQAVMIVCYELFGAKAMTLRGRTGRLVEQKELNQAYKRLRSALASLGYGERGNRKVLDRVTATLRQVFGRAGIEPHELRAIHGLCQQIERFTTRKSGSPHPPQQARGPRDDNRRTAS